MVSDGAATGPDDRWLVGWKEIAAYLGRPIDTVKNWGRAGKLPVWRPVPGSMPQIRASTLDRLLREGTATAEAAPTRPDPPRVVARRAR
ncbi:MAG: hypothetical protein HYZ11_08280 [Candidatus Tectomicrobia bacterium]|uniref:Helix-turn-helix domain-containing protein n=1 Tax=Tectimicrobiota bacterium TaxID=2528274 RepID=A0A932MLV1_UNCTE|nr:hypothetical protein [Candidatus Tectomicrobia bacterium]